MNQLISMVKNKLQFEELRLLIRVIAVAFFAFLLLSLCAPKKESAPVPVRQGPEGKLVYHSDELGNRIPDFSYCGYKASNKFIPHVPVKVIVPAKSGDQTERIQKAIDFVSSLPLNENGFRGAVLLEKGVYKLEGRLKIERSGVVLRGSGASENGTTIIADGVSRETLIKVSGLPVHETSGELEITDDFIPVNATTFSVKGVSELKVGDHIFIRRPSTQEWFDLLKMNTFGGKSDWLKWQISNLNIVWDRTITAIEGNTVTIDVPLTTALEQKFGGGFISKYKWEDRIKNIGIENLNLISAYNSENIKDEDHCWMAITMENVRDAWVRQMTFKNFAGSAVALYETASRVTVEDCKSFEPISEIAEFRRNTFFTSGQQTLFQRLYSEYGYHDFGVGERAPGPNAFVQCESYSSTSFSGAIDCWSSGNLFDIVNIDGHKLSYANRGQDGHGAGWTAANSVLWQCTAAKVECQKPPGAQNWAFGIWAQFAGDGYWNNSNNHIRPRSLFYAQLADRIGNDAIPVKPVQIISTNPTSSPSVELAAELAKELLVSPQTLLEFIDEKIEANPISLESNNAIFVDNLDLNTESGENTVIQPMNIKNGWLACNQTILTGTRFKVPWWSGSIRPRGIGRAKPAITRYVPGREGHGFTDNLEDVTNMMVQFGAVAMEQHYALWYDRRRDDHERIRRMDGDAWAPFYELPFARSGKELAWDGLSKYDLTKYNSWYWNRLKKFADLADEKNLILIHQNYFQHNILEAGAHWVDSPWRTVNNINNTGFPEPPPFAGDKRIFIADHFYDVTHPVRRELHRLYIRQCLENFKNNSNVIQLTSEEYTGPLHFVQFWIDVIKEWQEETGIDPTIGLSATKDVQDAILEDPVRSKYVDIIDIRYWSSRRDGSLFAPKGGQNLAMRQHKRQGGPGSRSIEQVYSDVLYYTEKFPDKAVIYSETQARSLAWGVFMAGGSLAPIPNIEAEGFLENASSMRPVESNLEGVWILENNKGERIYYCRENSSLDIDLEKISGKFELVEINPLGKLVATHETIIKGGEKTQIALKSGGDSIIWLKKI